MKFKVGDRVRHLTYMEDDLIPNGEPGTIVEIIDENNIEVDFDKTKSKADYKNNTWTVEATDIELIDETFEHQPDILKEVELEIECLESEVERYKLRMHQKKARLEAYREFKKMLEDR